MTTHASFRGDTAAMREKTNENAAATNEHVHVLWGWAEQWMLVATNAETNRIKIARAKPTNKDQLVPLAVLEVSATSATCLLSWKWRSTLMKEAFATQSWKTTRMSGKISNKFLWKNTSTFNGQAQRKHVQDTSNCLSFVKRHRKQARDNGPTRCFDFTKGKEFQTERQYFRCDETQRHWFRPCFNFHDVVRRTA